MIKKNYSEGTIFAVPLSTVKYVVGVVSRKTRSTQILVHLFASVFDHVPTLEEVGHLQSADAVLVLRTGGLGLIKGSWPIVGLVRPWERSLWPLPIFFREDPITYRLFAERYNDELKFVSEEPINDTKGMMSHALYGHIIIVNELEKQLTKLKIKL